MPAMSKCFALTASDIVIHAKRLRGEKEKKKSPKQLMARFDITDKMFVFSFVNNSTCHPVPTTLISSSLKAWTIVLKKILRNKSAKTGLRALLFLWTSLNFQRTSVWPNSLPSIWYFLERENEEMITKASGFN